MNNKEFLEVIQESFCKYLDKGTSRSTDKLKPLHGAIAKDIISMLDDSYKIKSQGYKDDKEANVKGRYYTKNIDITVLRQNNPVACFGVKFVVRNYSQNSNNYFENMLGETANIRTNNIPYFQIFICLDNIPYYKNNNNLQSFQLLTRHNLSKYEILSEDNTTQFYHTPDKTLITIIHLPENNTWKTIFPTAEQYYSYYKSKLLESVQIQYSNIMETSNFGDSVIYNDYEDFIYRSVCLIKGKGKR